jgi:hypothetical protein
MNKPEALISLAAEITKAIESFTEQDSNAKQVLTQSASFDPASFFAAAIGVVAAAKPSAGSRYLILSLVKDKRLGIGLLDPHVCTIQEAVAVTRAAAEAGVQLQSTFEMTLNKTLQGQSSPQKSERILRVMDILSVTCGQNCWNSFQVELMAYPDKVVRSKAALIIGKSTRNVAWIARRLLDRDPRVQASAVEAMWDMDPEETRPHFLSALKSKNNRVAANAALGLYLCGDATAVRLLLELVRHPDPLFRLSALWAIGETQDERFLPVLTDHYKHAEGKLRLATVGAMSRIRRREKTAHETSALQVHISQAVAQADGLRRLSFALSCHPARDLRAVKPGEFAVWENGIFIEEYQARLIPSPALLMVGFIVPWFASGLASADEPGEASIREALKQCISMKRRDDPWRIDRYSLEVNPSMDEKAALSAFPYDESLATPELKASHGCISDPDLLTKALSLASPAECAAPNPLAALQRQCDALGKRGAKRHVFVLLHDVSGFDWKDGSTIARLRTMAQESNVVWHGICPDLAGEWSPFRELCLSSPEGSFTLTKLDGMVDALVDAYANLCTRFELSYSLPASAESGPVKLKISSGFGQADIAVEVTGPPPPPEPVAVAAAPAPAAQPPAPPA